MAGINVRVDGLEEVNRKLQALGNPRIAKRIVRKVSRQAMTIVQKAAIQNARLIDDPETREKIWKNISVRAGKVRDSNKILMRVGVRGGASFSNPNPPNTSGGDTRHWRWIEYGRTGVPAVPFMRPALATNINAVTSKFAQDFGVEIDKELAKL